ncbi:MAG TPA: KpsF/GutQ family sugar-phosphate isomerase [Candidatus Hydrogenedentes bacterium]|nr:KpsF/GutQ family sugar-phosphate isomerase [Candidatus Hydrogenedentota bacterium]HOL77230.1 KpsF/GutQ family sugar-phosphate isomerase [Candidatus Hydrogenedentota bacterium]HOM98553.1 KpsF/GutQ family sugar-phosphate isomerase [Acetomicrobium sp.]HPO86519.1 KpsF/GutQ family sugar-phosphate isomerase [Candidatus Hydrogenedentota bacterium]
MSKDYLKIARDVLDIEAQAILNLKDTIDQNFAKTIDLIHKSKGRVVVTGIGKSGIIGQKFAASLASTGTPSLWVHSTEALHGDLGKIVKNDIVIPISYSGESEEVNKLLPIARKIGSKIISITGNATSHLASLSDIVLLVKVDKEACPMNLAPTASITAILALCDAIVVALIHLRGFNKKDFALYHPSGRLGKRLLLKTSDIMRKGKKSAIVQEQELLKDVLVQITEAKSGAAVVVDEKGILKGIFTDGDLRRHLERGANILKTRIGALMTSPCISIEDNASAYDAYFLLKDNKIDEVPVVNKQGKVLGVVDIQDLIDVGL